MASRKLIVEIIGDSRSLERSFGRVENRSEKFKKRLKVGLAGAGVAGAALAAQQLRASVDAALDAEKALTRLRGAFRSAGATQAQFAQAQKEIARVSREAAIDDEELSDTVARLTRTTGSAAKGLRAMALAANIARARGISLAAATNIVEKAHVGQLRGLRGVGVEIDRNTTSAQALERAQRKFAGSAAAYGKTASAAQERLNVAFENLQETVGAKLLPVLQRLAIRLTKIIESVEKDWPKIERVVKESVAAIRPAINQIVRSVKGVANVIAGVVRTVRAIKDGEWSQAWAGIKQVAVDGVAEVVKAVLLLPAQILRALGTSAFGQLKRIGGAIKTAALSGLQGLADGVVSVVQGAINRLIQLLNSAIGKLNKVPLLPDIPKVPELGAQAARTAAGRAARPGLRSERFVTAGVPVVQSFVTIEMDSEVVARKTTTSQQKTERRNPRQKRGPNSAYR